ncbi:MAG: PKD domain-containing protein [Chitinophagales bacterium]
MRLIFSCLLATIVFVNFDAKAQSCVELYGINFEDNVVVPVNLDPLTAVFDTITKISNTSGTVSFKRGGLAAAPSDRKMFFTVDLGSSSNTLNIREISFTNNQIANPSVPSVLGELQYDCNDSELYGVLNNGGNVQFVSVNDAGNISSIGGSINLDPNTILVEGISTIDSVEDRYFFAVMNTVSIGYTIYAIELNTGSVSSYDVPVSLTDLEFDATNGLLMAFTTAYDIVRINPVSGAIESTVATTPSVSLSVTTGNTAYDAFEDVLYVAGQLNSNGNHFLYSYNASTGVEISVSPLAGEIFDLTAGVPCLAIPDFTFENTCQGEETLFTDNSIGTISWSWDFDDPTSGAENTSTEENPTHTFSGPGIFDVTLTISGCIGDESVTIPVEISQAPLVDLGDVLTTCENSLVLTAPSYPDASYLWITGSGDLSITATQSRDDYWVEITIGTCVVRDTVEVILGEADTNSFAIQGIDQPVYCEGDVVTLDGSIVGTSVVYDWSTNEDTPTIEVTTSGTYTVVVTQNDCVFTDEVTLNFNSPPVVNIAQSGEICGDSTPLDATDIAGASYLWSTGETTPSITASTSGDYTVTVISAGCEVIATTNIELLGAIEVDLGANENDEITACSSETLVLNAGIGNPNATFEWSDGITTDSLFTVPANGNYSVIVTLGSTCTADKSVNVTFTDNFTVDLAPEVAICRGETFRLITGLVGANHEWRLGGQVVGTGEELEVSTAGTYSVSVTSGGCSAEGSTIVSVQELPVITLNQEDRSLCTDTGDSVTLDAGDGEGLSFEWSTGDETAQISVSTPGTYQVVATTSAGCSSTAAVNVVVRCESTLVVPTAFSPNNDNINDMT